MHRDSPTLSDGAISLWRQNPLLEALPVLSIPAAVRQLDSGISSRPAALFSLPLAVRLERLVDLLHFFRATPQEADCLQSFTFCMRDSYMRRNPNDPVVYRELVNQGTRINEVTIRPLVLPNAKAQMILLRGGRGVGISSFLARVEAILGSDPRAITLEHQPSTRAFHIPTLRVQWPSCSTESGFGRSLLAEIDARFSTSYLHNTYRKSASRAAILPRAQTLASLLNVGLLLVDNGKFGTLDAEACVALLPVLERFSAQTGIPIVMALDDDSMMHVTQHRGTHLSAACTRERVFKPLTSDGVVLLPYQALIALMDGGQDVSGALAWAPQDADIEFSYVTEHVSDDTAIAALNSLRSAADGMIALGLDVKPSAISWLDRQIERLWQLRGPAPGMAAVLGHLGVESAHRVVRQLASEPEWQKDPWAVVTRALDAKSALAAALVIPSSIGSTWRGLDAGERAMYQVLSAMDVSRDQVTALVEGNTSYLVEPDELVDNPYFAASCTYRSRFPIALETVDHACFPAAHVQWANVIEKVTGLNDPGDARRVEALLVEVLERLAEEGDTIADEAHVLRAASEIPLIRPCPISRALVNAYNLSAASLGEYARWTPLVGASLEDGSGAYKLLHLHEVGRDISDFMHERRKAKRFDVLFDPRAAIESTFGPVDPADPEESLARAEKAAGLAELFSSRLSVLVGPAGTGKTTLLRMLVQRPEVQQDGVLLLAPTGKARVQMQTKVGYAAQTLASFLVEKGGFDADTGRYLTVDASERARYGLVVIDEASMLTEEMLAATISALNGVKRLILVGDHRQLPPIGAGRPFVDLVEWLKPESFAGGTRVAPGYVELTVFRRQKEGVDVRDDLALAQWFGGEELPGAADEIWQRLRLGQSSETLTYRQWGKEGVIKTLMSAIEDELGLGTAIDKERAFKLTYGAKLSPDGQYVNWPVGEGGTGEQCEDWQVLSPVRSRVFGTVEINRLLKRAFRSGDLQWALKSYGFRPPRPIGPEQIVLGDKVMQTRNDSRAKAYPDGAGLDYIANGEIGVVVGRAATSPKFANVEFSSQAGATYGYKPSAADDPPLELAWAVTVHKSQGSEFGTTFLVLPSRVAVSRELLYTALTRQTKRIVVLHEGTVDDLFSLASPARSETARRMTNLFRAPKPRELKFVDGLRRFDANLIHVAPGGVLVRSKNEVIVASILEDLAAGRWDYEVPLTIDGVTKYPDFTIETSTGDQVIWEHLGMMGNPRYAAEWTAKKAWYVAHGFRPYDEPDTASTRGVLIWTDDRGGVDQPAWVSLAQSVLGVAAPRRVAKKVAAKKGG